MQNYYWLVIAILALANIISFFLIGLDKFRSVRAENRVPEVYFFFCSIFFSSLGVLFGMYFFHHKTRKWYFPVGIGLLFVQQVALVMLIVEKMLLRLT